MAGRHNGHFRSVVIVLHRGTPTLLTTLLACIAMSATPMAWGGVRAYAAGDIAECKSTPQKSAAAQTAKMIPADAMVFVVGDTTYPTADRATLESCYTRRGVNFSPEPTQSRAITTTSEARRTISWTTSARARRTGHGFAPRWEIGG